MNESAEVETTEEIIGLLHGFSQTSACWGSLPERLAPGRQIIAIDLPGHGRSALPATDLWQSGDLACDAIGSATYLGYSLGGRVALHAALRHPDKVQRLILISATAGIDDPIARAERQAADEQLAVHIESIGVDEFVEEWLNGPLFAGLTDASNFIDERRTNNAPGLAGSLRLSGTGAQQPLFDRLHELDMPVLVVAGALDTKFTEQGERLVEGIGDNATLAIMGSAGHSVHLEQPAAFADLVDAWLESHPVRQRATAD